MQSELNVFNQYDHAENRLTHALGITLDRAKDFRTIFLKKLTGKSQLTADARVMLQMASGVAEVDGEKCGIPDLAIIDKEGDYGIIVEAKLGASLSWQQLASHERRAKRNNLEVMSALAITGRDKDRDAVERWNREGRFLYPWRHVGWPEIYGLACQHAHLNPWVRELRDYMEIMAASMDEKEMGADVKVIDFAGISEEMIENYSPAIAKRILRSIMDELRSDKKFLKDIGISGNNPPRKRKAIKNLARVWDFLSPVGDGDSFTKSHHFTVGLNRERIEASLTIPNASFGKFKKYARSISAEEFAGVIDSFTNALKRTGVIQAGGRPFIVIVQRRFHVMTQYAEDGRMEFDLRTWTGSKHGKKEPEIKQQKEWLEFCHKLVTERDSNIQFQIGARFDFASCTTLRGQEALGLIKDTFRTVMPVVRKAGYGGPLTVPGRA